MKNNIIYISLAAMALCFCSEVYGQEHPERRHIRSGNRDFEALDYGAAEGDYRSAQAAAPLSYEAAFNLGDALYKQERYDEATGVFDQLSQNPALTAEQMAKVHYNLGNTQFQQQKLSEAAESYKKSLIMNPNDVEAKFNLAYVQKLLEDQQGGGGGNDDQKDDQNNDQNQDNQNDEQNQDSQNNQQDQDQENQQDQQNSDQSDPDKGQDDQSNQDDQASQPDKPEPGEGSPREAAISRDDAEKMLEAIQDQEDKTREKMDEKKKVLVAPSGKNW